MRRFWDLCANNQSYLQCLDDLFHDKPSFNFTDVRSKVVKMPSVLARQQHLRFDYVMARQFDKAVRLDYATIQRGARDFGTWRGDQDFGAMNPVQRREVNGEQTDFPPLALARVSAAAWFDSQLDKPWTTGMSPLLAPLVRR
jgi:hypothetical protein